MFLSLLFFLVTVRMEIIKITESEPVLIMKFRLDGNNINTGFFEALESENMVIRTSIISSDNTKTLFTSESLMPNTGPARFSFNNSDELDMLLKITGSVVDSSLPAKAIVEFKFESSLDSFNQDVSKKMQYEPAIYALDVLLKKLNDITVITKNEYMESGQLGQEQKNMLFYVILFSNATFIFFCVSNFVQFYRMKAYLKTKKYL